MHIALDCGEEYLSGISGISRFSCFDIGLEDAHSLFHGASGLHHLRQEHLALAKQLSDGVHAFHQRSLDDIHRTGIFLQSFFQVVFQVVTNSFDQSG